MVARSPKKNNKKNQHQEVSWPRGTWQNSILALLRDCMPIEMVTAVEEGQNARRECSFMAALLSQGKGLQRELMQPAGWLMNGVTIVEEIKKLTRAP